MSYAKDNSGIIHAISALMTEFTLCGNAFDGDADKAYGELDPLAWEEVKRGPVTCVNCATVILGAKGIRIAPSAKKEVLSNWSVKPKGPR